MIILSYECCEIYYNDWEIVLFTLNVSKIPSYPKSYFCVYIACLAETICNASIFVCKCTLSKYQVVFKHIYFC